MIEIKAPNPVPQDTPTIFLAGSIDMGAAVNWQQQVVEALKGLEDITIVNPRRDDWDSSWEQSITNDKFSEQVNWEMQQLENANLVLFYFDPKGQAPITLLELGYVLGLATDVIVCCPEGYWRRGNVQVACDRNRVPCMDTLEDLISEAWSFFSNEAYNAN